MQKWSLENLARIGIGDSSFQSKLIIMLFLLKFTTLSGRLPVCQFSFD